MKTHFAILQSIWSKFAVGISLIASLTAILTVDFSPPLPTTSVFYLNVIEKRFLENGEFRAFAVEANPELLTREVTESDLAALNVPERFFATKLAVENQGDIEIEDLTVSFVFYENAGKLFNEQFAGELTLGPGRLKSSEFHNPAASRANLLEVCLKYNSILPFARVTERFLINSDRRLSYAFSSLIEYDRRRAFFRTKSCHKPPSEATLAAIK